MNFMLKHYTPDFFQGKRILELGAFNGYVGACMQQLGADVLSIEGRTSNVKQIRKNFPQLKCEVGDLDTDVWAYGKWDIIINFGLYYHLQHKHEAHLKNCIQNCDLMFFETVIRDNYQPMIFYRKESGSDQSLSGVGGYPTTSYVENIFNSMGVTYTKYNDSALNGGDHTYDWVDSNSNEEKIFQRRFWIVKTNTK